MNIFQIFGIIIYGFISGCVPYTEIPRCYEYQADQLHWKNTDFPLSIAIADHETHRPTILRAIRIWNESVDATVFEIADQIENSNIFIETRELRCNPICVQGLTALALYEDTPFIRWVNIDLDNSNITVQRTTIIAIHELGHALGLMHDCNTNSIMHHSAPSNSRIERRDIVYVQWQMMM